MQDPSGQAEDCSGVEGLNERETCFNPEESITEANPEENLRNLALPSQPILRNRRSRLHPNNHIQIAQPIITEPSGMHSPASEEDLVTTSSSMVYNPVDHQKIIGNYLFGFKPWKGMLGERSLSKRSDTVKKLYMWNDRKPKMTTKSLFLNVGNVLYAMIIGWWMFLMYIIVGALCFIPIVTIPYGRKCFSLAFYFFYPFGKYIEDIHEEEQQTLFSRVNAEEGQQALSSFNNDDLKSLSYYSTVRSSQSIGDFIPQKRVRHWSVLGVVSFTVWAILLAPILTLSHLACCTLSWFSVIGIPTSKIHFTGIKLLFNNMLTLNVNDQYPPSISSEILLCTYQATNIYYYKYNVFGINVILLNMLPFSIVSIVLGMAFGDDFVAKFSLLIFPLCLLSTVPLAYMIGKAVAAISAQTNFVIGAVLNASFGSIIELILYFLALWKNLHDVVVTAVTGALLVTTLLVPGLAMIVGGVKYKQQFFNKQAASVSSALLLIAVVGSLLPSLFYQVYSENYELSCGTCVNTLLNDTHPFVNVITSVNGSSTNGTYGLICQRCTYVEKDPMTDPIYINRARPLAYAVAAVLPLAYCIGLIFSLKTHRYLIERPPVPENKDDIIPHEEEAGIGAEWPIWVCVVVLIISTIIYSLVAEVMTASLEPAFELLHISPNFAGLTFLAIVPSCAEFVNAIQFAIQNNITLALEIGNTASVQIALIQIPCLVAFSAILFSTSDATRIFNLLFPQMHLIAIFFAVIVLNYVSLEGRTNYFQGSALVIVYILIVVTFFFANF